MLVLDRSRTDEATELATLIVWGVALGPGAAGVSSSARFLLVWRVKCAGQDLFLLLARLASAGQCLKVVLNIAPRIDRDIESAPAI